MSADNLLRSQQPSRTFRLKIKIADEDVQFDLSLPEGPATWEHLLPFMRTLLGVSKDISQEYFSGKGQLVSCRAGCTFCCHQRVPITEFEAHRLRRLVDSLPEPRRSEVIARFQTTEERIKSAGANLEIDTATLSMDEIAKRAANYLRLMIPCPFLENDTCSIYDERPLKCREYLVVSPAQNCADPESNQVQGLPLPLKVFMTAVSLENKAGETQSRWILLTDLLKWTDENRPTEPTRTGAELLQEFMSRLIQTRGWSENRLDVSSLESKNES